MRMWYQQDLTHCGCQGNLTQSLWKAQFALELNMYLPYDPAVPWKCVPMCTERHVQDCLEQHYSSQLNIGNNQNVYQQVIG